MWSKFSIISYHIISDMTYIYICILFLVISIRHSHTFATRQCTLEPGSRQCRMPIHSPQSQKRFPPACVRGFGRRSSQLPRVRDLASPLILKATCDCHQVAKGWCKSNGQDRWGTSNRNVDMSNAVLPAQINLQRPATSRGAVTCIGY